MKALMILSAVAVGVLLSVLMIWLIAFIETLDISFSLEAVFEKIFVHAERTAKSVNERRRGK